MCVWVFESEKERQCLIETEPVGLVIYSLFRFSFPKVHSSLPSTRRQGAKLLHSPPRWANSPHLGKVKAISVYLNRSKGNSFLSLHFDLHLLYFLSLNHCVACVMLLFLFLCCMYLVEMEKGASVFE